jgi:hypothetical protein
MPAFISKLAQDVAAGVVVLIIIIIHVGCFARTGHFSGSLSGPNQNRLLEAASREKAAAGRVAGVSLWIMFSILMLY